jgi:hypothetical protein
MPDQPQRQAGSGLVTARHVTGCLVSCPVPRTRVAPAAKANGDGWSASVAARWPVLSVHQLRHREQREIPCCDAGDLQIVGSRTRAGYALPA